MVAFVREMNAIEAYNGLISQSGVMHGGTKKVFSYMEAEMGYTNVRKYYNLMRSVCSKYFIEIRRTFQHEMFDGFFCHIFIQWIFVNY